MPYTAASLRGIIRSRKYPSCVLSEADVQVLIDLVFMRLNVTAAVTKVTSFTAVSGQQDYAVFNPNDEVTEGCCENAELILNVQWSSMGTLNTADILNPGYTVTQDMLLQESYFSRPVDMIILRQKLSAWRDQFGMQSWKLLGHYGDPNSVLRLYNTPTAEDITVFIEYTEGTDLTSLDNTQMEAFWAWFEYYIAEAMANYFSQTAGIELLGFATKEAGLKYWQRKSTDSLAAAYAKTHGIRGEAERT
jgi:hypothetical protein